MNNYLGRVTLCLALFVVGHPQLVLSDDWPSVDQIKAACRENLLLNRHPRIVWRERITDYPSSREALLKMRISSFERYLSENPDLDEKQSAVIQRQLLRMRVAFARRGEAEEKSVKGTLTHCLFDLWTDRKAIQIRSPISDQQTEQHLQQLLLRPPLAQASNLQEAFASTHIVAWTESKSATLKVWQGLGPKDGEGSGMTGRKGLESTRTNRLLPPLGQVNRSWGAATIFHPIDLFFASPTEEMKVVGQETIDGETTYLVVHNRLTPAQEKISSGRLERQDSWKAWIAPQRGFFALRMEFSSGRYVHNGNVLNEDGLKPDQVIELKDLRKRGERFFYPGTILSTWYRWDETSRVRVPSVEEQIRGAKYSSQVVVSRRAEMEFFLIRDQLIPEHRYGFAFPSGTQYYDSDNQRFEIAEGEE